MAGNLPRPACVPAEVAALPAAHRGREAPVARPRGAPSGRAFGACLRGAAVPSTARVHESGAEDVGALRASRTWADGPAARSSGTSPASTAGGDRRDAADPARRSPARW